MTERASGAQGPAPTLSEAMRVWWTLGVLSFGGPAAQIALMHRMVVEERGWLSERRYLDALSFCMLLPGPEAMQLATYAGWRLHGVRGGLAAGVLFVLPGAVVMGLLATLYVLLGDVPWVGALFVGIKAAVLVIVIEALLRVARRALAGPEPWAIAALAFVALFALAVPYPLVVLGAALWGALRLVQPAARVSAPVSHAATWGQTLGRAALWLAIWAVPLVALGLVAPTVFADVARFFSVLAMVTFGGAYAVLAYMAQEAVTTQGWLTAEEMLDALGLAETTPGPLILVTEFVGFLAGYRAAPGGSLVWGWAAAAVTLWATFAPCFLWIFVGAPWIEHIGRVPRLRAALSGVSAAVVGVIANLSVWFALHVMFADVNRVDLGPLHLEMPVLPSLNPIPVAIALVAALSLLRLKRSVPETLALCAMLGLLSSLVFRI